MTASDPGNRADGRGRDGHDRTVGHDSFVVRLPPDQLVELADLVAERLCGDRLRRERDGLVDARGVADAIGMSAAWVREHAAELGGRRMGDGPRGRWRFDLDVALQAWAARSAGERSLSGDPLPAQALSPRRATLSGTNVELLPIRAPRGGRRAA